MKYVTIISDSEELEAVDVTFEENGEVHIQQYHKLEPHQDLIILTPDMRAELVAVLTNVEPQELEVDTMDINGDELARAMGISELEEELAKKILLSSELAVKNRNLEKAFLELLDKHTHNSTLVRYWKLKAGL